MFDIVAKRYQNVLALPYEKIISDRDFYFRQLSDFFGMEYSNGNYDFSKQEPTHSNPVHNIARSDKEVFKRKNKFLSDSDIQCIKEIISDQFI
jgi:hypothetical protein